MDKNIEQLIRLVKENPDLPVVPKVDSDIITDVDYSWWIGSIGEVCVDEYVMIEDRIFLKRDENMDYVVEVAYRWDVPLF